MADDLSEREAAAGLARRLIREYVGFSRIADEKLITLQKRREGPVKEVIQTKLH